jgi:hypothetical protein
MSNIALYIDKPGKGRPSIPEEEKAQTTSVKFYQEDIDRLERLKVHTGRNKSRFLRCAMKYLEAHPEILDQIKTYE